jgi:hypothetical protein
MTGSRRASAAAARENVVITETCRAFLSAATSGPALALVAIESDIVGVRMSLPEQLRQ